MKHVTELTPADFGNLFITLSYGSPGKHVERFVVTRIGRIDYAVSMETGYAYTRPQLIDKYSRINADVTEMSPRV